MTFLQDDYFQAQRCAVAENEENKRLRAALATIISEAQFHAAHHHLSIDGQKFYDIAEEALSGNPPSILIEHKLTEDEMHVLRILGNGQISAARGAELIREIRRGGKPELMPFEPPVARPHRVMVCGADCYPGDAICNNYCNMAPQKGPMASAPPPGPDA